MSPEYSVGGFISEKSDVFSFGILLLEIVSGQKNANFHGSNQIDLPEYVSPMISSLPFIFCHRSDLSYFLHFTLGMETVERRKGLGVDGSSVKGFCRT